MKQDNYYNLFNFFHQLLDYPFMQLNGKHIDNIVIYLRTYNN